MSYFPALSNVTSMTSLLCIGSENWYEPLFPTRTTRSAGSVSLTTLDPTRPRETPYGEKTRPGCCHEQELIALRTLMINQAREVFCQGRFSASLIYVLIENRCPVNSHAASLS